MHATPDKSRIRDALSRLAHAHSQSRDRIEQEIRTLTALIDGEQPIGEVRGNRKGDQTTAHADRATLSIVWGKRSCFLGNTLLLAVFERLARSPGQFIATDDLIEEVWGGYRERSTVRGVIKRLRDRLRGAKMGGLADAIEGDVAGYYRLRRV